MVARHTGSAEGIRSPRAASGSDVGLMGRYSKDLDVRRVYLVYAAAAGHVFLDRALYLPQSWTADRQRCPGRGWLGEGLAR